MAEPPESLKKAQLWAVEALAFAKEKVGTDSLLWGQQVIGTSSMFSGCGYGERALEYIHAARALHGKDLGSLTAPWLLVGIDEQKFNCCKAWCVYIYIYSNDYIVMTIYRYSIDGWMDG